MRGDLIERGDVKGIYDVIVFLCLSFFIELMYVITDYLQVVFILIFSNFQRNVTSHML